MTAQKDCRWCKGRGYIEERADPRGPSSHYRVTCEKCSPDVLVARDECSHCMGTGEESIGVDDTGQECFVPYCDYCGEFAQCKDCGWKGEEGERIVATLDAIQGTSTGYDLLCPECGKDSCEIVSE